MYVQTTVLQLVALITCALIASASNKGPNVIVVGAGGQQYGGGGGGNNGVFVIGGQGEKKDKSKESLVIIMPQMAQPAAPAYDPYPSPSYHYHRRVYAPGYSMHRSSYTPPPPPPPMPYVISTHPKQSNKLLSNYPPSDGSYTPYVVKEYGEAASSSDLNEYITVI